MTDIIPISISSYRVVAPELHATIQEASNRYEAFVADTSALTQLEESLAAVRQVEGVLKLFNFPGSLTLVQEMAALMEHLLKQNGNSTPFALSAMSHALVILPCYLEYLADKEQALPVLVMPFVNELRAAQRKPILLESEVAEYVYSGELALASSGEATMNGELASHLRQMYQIGLLGLLREENVKAKLQLMHRAMQRLAQASLGLQIRGQWLLGEAVLAALVNDELGFDFTRKRVLSLLDGEMRKLSQQLPSEVTADTELISELIYLLALSGNETEAAAEVRAAVTLPQLSLNDQQLQQERRIMHGPNAQTIEVMVTALREELLQSKEVLEIAAQSNVTAEDFERVASVFQRTADILMVIGLNQASQIMQDMHLKVKAYAGNDEAVDKNSLLSLADGVLYVESLFSDLNRFDLNFAEQAMDESGKRALMSQSQFKEAQDIVIEEALASIVQSKKEITSFAETGFEKSHLEPVLQSLSEVRGAMLMLKYQQPAHIIDSCMSYVNAILNENPSEETYQRFLEVMADVLISLEYYLSEIAIKNPAPNNVLQVASHDLNELGFTVKGN